MLLAGSSVHGRGMVEPLALVGIDHNGVVVSVRALAPGDVARLPGAKFTVELPATVQLPEPGWSLTLSDYAIGGDQAHRRGGDAAKPTRYARVSVRPTHHLCDTDR